MLNHISGFIVTVYLIVGVAGFGYLAILLAYEGISDAFLPCYTVLPDGSVSEETDSFHLRTWVLGLAIPSYRATALRGIARISIYAAIAAVAGLIAVALGIGIAG